MIIITIKVAVRRQWETKASRYGRLNIRTSSLHIPFHSRRLLYHHPPSLPSPQSKAPTTRLTTKRNLVFIVCVLNSFARRVCHALSSPRPAPHKSSQQPPTLPRSFFPFSAFDLLLRGMQTPLDQRKGNSPTCVERVPQKQKPIELSVFSSSLGQPHIPILTKRLTCPWDRSTWSIWCCGRCSRSSRHCP